MGSSTAPAVLVPYDRREALTLAEAVEVAGRSASTVRTWCASYHIGRRLAGGPWKVSRPALLMLLDGDRPALEAYLSGERGGVVASYFARAGVEAPA